VAEEAASGRQRHRQEAAEQHLPQHARSVDGAGDEAPHPLPLLIDEADEVGVGDQAAVDSAQERQAEARPQAAPHGGVVQPADGVDVLGPHSVHPLPRGGVDLERREARHCGRRPQRRGRGTPRSWASRTNALNASL
jgi:hypothetical protein